MDFSTSTQNANWLFTKDQLTSIRGKVQPTNAASSSKGAVEILFED